MKRVLVAALILGCGAAAAGQPELNHRDLWICVSALGALNKLTGQSLVFDFRVPTERKRAVDAFAATH